MAITTTCVDICYGRGTLVLINETDQLCYSIDNGVTWTSVSKSFGNELESVFFFYSEKQTSVKKYVLDYIYVHYYSLCCSILNEPVFLCNFR